MRIAALLDEGVVLVNLSDHGLAEDGSPFVGVGAADVAEVDFVVFSGFFGVL